MTHRRIGLVIVGVLGVTGCGAGDIGDNGDDIVDARGCELGIAFDPVEIVAGPDALVRVNGSVTGATGFVTYAWSVMFDGTEVATTPAAADNRDVFFTAAAGGVYDVTFSAGDCDPVSATFNATTPGANDVAYRLRVQPPDGAGLPASERVVVVRGGADASLGTIALSDGVAASGRVVVDGLVAPAYLRATPSSQPALALETFASADGGFSLRALVEPHRLLVVPSSPTLAPAEVTAWSPLTPDVNLDAGRAVATEVLGPDGQPLVGARVSLLVDGVPSSGAVTDAAGAATVWARFAGAVDVAVDVQPAAASAWPRLTAQLGGVDLTAGVAVAYQPTLVAQPVDTVVLTHDGAPVAGAAVALSATHAEVGTVSVGAVTASAAGATLRRGTTDGAGALVLAPVTRASFLLAARSPDAAGVVTIDLTGAPPPTVAVPSPTTMQLIVRAADGAPLAGTRGSAVAVGGFAALGPVRREVVAGADGRLAWPDAPGARWDLSIEDPLGRAARWDAAGLDGAALSDVTLPVAVTLSGAVMRATGGAAVRGAVVTLYCGSCTGIAAQRPIATAVSSAVGTFHLAVPDPGVVGR